jgi:hypothetical protein
MQRGAALLGYAAASICSIRSSALRKSRIVIA